jgi:hypothetical protein
VCYVPRRCFFRLVIQQLLFAAVWSLGALFHCAPLASRRVWSLPSRTGGLQPAKCCLRQQLVWWDILSVVVLVSTSLPPFDG